MGDTILYMTDCERAKSAPMNAELITKQDDVIEKPRASAVHSRQIETPTILAGLIVFPHLLQNK